MKRTSCFSVAEPWHSSSETKSQHSRPKCCPWGHERKEEDNGELALWRRAVVYGNDACRRPFRQSAGLPPTAYRETALGMSRADRSEHPDNSLKPAPDSVT